jgi:hypothetical protein
MSHPLTQGLAACWLLNDTGMRAMDVGPYGNHGLLTNFTDPPKRPFNGLQFDGSDDYILAGNHQSLQLSQNFMIEAWVQSNDVTADKTIMARRITANSFQFNLGSVTPGKIYVSGWVAAAEAFSIQSSRVLVNQQLVQVVWAYSGGSKLFIDGGLDNTDNYANALDTGSTDTTIGAWALNGAGSWPGKIFMVRVWNRLPLGSINAMVRSLHQKPYEMFL